MKLLLVTVSAIAFFTADGRNFRSETENQESTSKAQPVPGETDGQGWLNIINEAEVQISAELDQQLREDNIYVDGLQKSDFGHEDQEWKESNVVVAGENQEHDSTIFNIQDEKRQYERKSNKSSCKAKSTCVIVGGYCVTNTALCSGRLVPQGCKGSKCQCCLPGIIEAKLEILEEEIKLFKDDLNYLNDTNSNYNSDLTIIKHNMSNSNSELHLIKDNVKNMSSTLNTNLDTFKANINNLTGHLTSKVETLSSEMKNMSSSLETIKMNINDMNSTLENLGCPTETGYFAYSNQCFRFLADSAGSWDTAKSRCTQLGLVLAKPNNPVELRNVMIGKFGDKTAWIGARGTGTYVNWVRDGTTLGSSDSTWYPNRPAGRTSTSYCLQFLTMQHFINGNPTRPYSMDSCSYTGPYPLCEKVE